jgi:hypothetical protein
VAAVLALPRCAAAAARATPPFCVPSNIRRASDSADEPASL